MLPLFDYWSLHRTEMINFTYTHDYESNAVADI